MVYPYFEIGRMIVEGKRHGANRAAYGTRLLKELSVYLIKQFGKGYLTENLKLMHHFYVMYSENQLGKQRLLNLKNSPSPVRAVNFP